MKLSLSMILKNEEKYLPGCLQSVRGLVDEIVVVDTGSTDSTKHIAEAFGAKIFDFEWCNDFSAARNESLGKTTGDWVLYLDADERIDTSYHRKIIETIRSGRADAYLLNLKSKIGVKKDALYHFVSYPRLLRKIPGISFVGKVHEQVTTSLNRLHARIMQTDIIIEHLGYAQEDEVIREKARRNYELLLSQVEKGENYGYAVYQLGQTEIILGDVKKGLAHLHEALRAGGFGKSVEASIYGIIAENTFKQGEYDAALDACDRSLAAGREQTFAHMMKGEIYLKLDRPADAQQAFEQALEGYNSGVARGNVATAVEPVFDVDVLFSKLGRAASAAGHDVDAKSYFAKAAEINPSSEKVAAYLEFLLSRELYHEAVAISPSFSEHESEDWYLRLLSAAYMELEDYNRASALLHMVVHHDAVSWSSLGNCLAKLGDYEGAVDAFRRAVECGYSDPRGLEFYGMAQFMRGKFDGAIMTLKSVLAADPSNSRARKFMLAAEAQLKH